jgi:hypothetical protein
MFSKLYFIIVSTRAWDSGLTVQDTQYTHYQETSVPFLEPCLTTPISRLFDVS